MLDQNKIASSIQALQNQLGMTNEELGRSLKGVGFPDGVSGSYISQIKNGNRNMSMKLFKVFVDTYGLDPDDYYEGEHEKEVNVAETLNHLRKIRGLDLAEISERSGIDMLDLSQLMRGKLKPTPEHIKKLSTTFKVKPEIISQGRIFRSFEVIRREMLSLNLDKEFVDHVLQAIKREL